MGRTAILILVLSSGCGSLTIKQVAYQGDNPFAENIEIAVAELNAHFGCSIVQLKVKNYTSCNDLDLENEICMASNERVYKLADNKKFKYYPAITWDTGFQQDIFLNADLFAEKFSKQKQGIILHELGHSMGLEHDDNPSAIMYEKADKTAITDEMFNQLVSSLKEIGWHCPKES